MEFFYIGITPKSIQRRDVLPNKSKVNGTSKSSIVIKKSGTAEHIRKKKKKMPLGNEVKIIGNKSIGESDVLKK